MTIRLDMLSSLFRSSVLASVLAILMLGVTACTDVGVQPKSSLTANTVFSEPENYKTYLAKLYGGLVLTGQEGPFGSDDIGVFGDEGKGGYSRVYWNLQTTPTDEVVNSWVNDPAVNPFTFQQWSPGNGLLSAMFARIYFQTSNANKFLELTSDVSGVSSEMKKNIERWRAEARFLRALSYWHGLDLFRNIPLTTKTGGAPPEQASPKKVFNFIEKELKEITNEKGTENLLPAGQAEYGRADKGAAWTLLTKLYLNAEVYIGEKHYQEAAQAAAKVINSGAYSLAIGRPYGDLFRADNHTHPGIIFPLPQDGVNTQTYSNTTFLMHATSGGNMGLKQLRGITGSWLGYRGTPELVNKFGGRKDTTTYPDSSFYDAPDSRALFFTDGQQKEVKKIGNPGKTFKYGYGVIKYKNITSDGEIGKNLTFPDTDFPMFRLADVYLMYAEAVERWGASQVGGTPSPVDLVNKIRDRAYADNSAGNVTSGDLNTKGFFLDERARELYHEAHRRTDLIRFGKFSGGEYVWSWKGGKQKGTSTPNCKNIYPIPTDQLAANTNLKQNKGYPGCTVSSGGGS